LITLYIIHQGEEVHDYSQSAKIRREGYKGLLHRGLYTIFSTTRYVKTLSDNNYESYIALSLNTRGARWEEFSREKKNYRQRSVQQQFNNGDFLEQVGAREPFVTSL
jgi:hypothetical protein